MSTDGDHFALFRRIIFAFQPYDRHVPGFHSKPLARPHTPPTLD